jgi:hypothetical protein
MKRLILATLLTFFPLLAHAITWDFDEDGNTQGWQAREPPNAAGPYTPILSSVVRDGIWRIEIPEFQPKHNPGVTLISPIIDRDSALFDRVVIRFRLVHIRPVEGWLGVAWTNPRNKDLPGNQNALAIPSEDTQEGSLLAFYKGFSQLYTTDWQEVVIGDLQTETFVSDKELVKRVWEGILNAVRVLMAPYETREENNYLIQGPEEVPEAIEVDWIKLTGVEELLQGELVPPVVNPLGVPGRLFSAAQFVPLKQQGIYGIESPPLVDLDGDGDLDLILTWWGGKVGLISAENDGLGGFRPGHLLVPAYENNFIPALVGGADVNRDGKGDVFFKLSNDIEVLLSVPGEEGTYTQEVVVSGMLSRGLADYDGDGDLDLWLSPATLGGLSLLSIWLNDGRGHFTQGPDFSGGEFAPYAIRDLDGDGRVDVAWVPRFDFPQPAIKMSPGIGEWGLDKSYLLEIDSTSLDKGFRSGFMKDVGDYDGDGDVDAILVSEWKNKISDNTYDSSIPSRGLQVAINDGTQHLHPTPWYGEKVEILGALSGYSAQAWDLDGDGLLDPVVINDNPRYPGVMVHLGRRDGLPVLEGYYDLPNDGRGVWAGDVDSDKDLDLVVIDPVYQGGGVHLLLNQSSPATIVEEITATLPVQSHLGAAYPNPFNPGVVIPFTLGPSAQPVSLTIYNILGQEVRRLELGELPAGTHQVQWDGRDGLGAELSSGVYLYRLQAGAWGASGKMVKSE